MRSVLAFLAAIAVAGTMTSCSKRADSDVTANGTKMSQPQSSAAREPSQHNWPKQALNRANDVKRQVAEQRKGQKAVESAEADQP